MRRHRDAVHVSGVKKRAKKFKRVEKCLRCGVDYANKFNLKRHMRETSCKMCFVRAEVHDEIQYDETCAGCSRTRGPKKSTLQEGEPCAKCSTSQLGLLVQTMQILWKAVLQEIQS